MAWQSRTNNFARANLISGISSTTTTVPISSQSCTLFPTVTSSASSFNVVCWDSSTYPDPSISTDKEILRVVKNKKSTNSFTVYRGQEGTTAVSHSVSGKTYTVMLDFSKKEKDNVIEDYLFPTGQVLPFQNQTIPQGWVICLGQSLSRTNSQYSRLYSLIGTRFGYNSSSHFNVPNLDRRVIVSVNQSDTDTGAYSVSTMNVQSGAKTHTLTLDELPSHGGGHVQYYSTATIYTNPWPIPFPPPPYPITAVKYIDLQSLGLGQPHNNMMRYVTMVYAIKL